MLVRKVRELAAKRVEVEDNMGLFGSGSGVGDKDKKTRRRVQIEESLMEVAHTMTDNMICKMESKSFIRGAYYLATQLLTRAYHQGMLNIKIRGTLYEFYGALIGDRYPRFKRRSPSSKSCRGASGQEQAVYYIPSMSQIACGLCAYHYSYLLETLANGIG
jgi:hypothetical protein